MKSVGEALYRFWKSLTRKKVINKEAVMNTRLERTLKTFDLMVIGVGATLGVSIYVMLGETAREIAGPSIVVSLLVDAVAAIMSGLCYAELAARMPIAGSAYTFTSAVMGESLGFMIGWNLLFEYMIGTALFARGFTAYFDKILDGEISRFMYSFASKIDLWGSNTYPDFIALLICLVLTLVIAFGWKPTKIVLYVTVGGNVLIIILIVIIGAVYAEPKNWNNFMPHGFLGTVKGASTCFYAFVGFDVIAMSVEEAKNPAKSIPYSIIGSIVCCVVAFISIAIVMTILVPYTELSGDAALLTAFTKRGLNYVGYFIVIGMVFALIGGLTATLIPLPRLVYALSQDGMIFGFFKKVNETTKVPVIATLISGTLSGIIALCFDLNNLIRMTSLGTLMAYTSISLCVILSRYSVKHIGLSTVDNSVFHEKNGNQEQTETSFIDCKIGDEAECSNKDNDAITNASGDTKETPVTSETHLINSQRKPTEKSQRIVAITVFLILLQIGAISFIVIYAYKDIYNLHVLVIVGLVVLFISLFSSLGLIKLQPENPTGVFFKVPFVPWLPTLSLMINIFLLLLLDKGSWIRFGIWMLLGCLIYFGYGIRHSKISQSSARDGYSPIED